MSKEANTFKSRYGVDRTIEKVGPDEYIIRGHSLYSRGGMTEDGKVQFIDFEGGPFIQLGMDIGLFMENDDARKIIRLEQENNTPPVVGVKVQVA